MTAVERLIEQYHLLMLDAEINDTHFSILDKKRDEIFEQAKAIEKEQITHAWENGALPDLLKEYKNSRTYYNETYGELEVYGKDSN